MRYFGRWFSRLRLLVILVVQNLSFRRAAGVILLTRHAGKVIQQSCRLLPAIAYIPNGVDVVFKYSQTSSIASAILICLDDPNLPYGRIRTADFTPEKTTRAYLDVLLPGLNPRQMPGLPEE